MADEAALALGAPTIAGTFVNPKGMAKKMTASVPRQAKKPAQALARALGVAGA